jgi:hypothetical protein
LKSLALPAVILHQQMTKNSSEGEGKSMPIDSQSIAIQDDCCADKYSNEAIHPTEPLLLDDALENDGMHGVSTIDRRGVRGGISFPWKMRDGRRLDANQDEALLSSCPDLDCASGSVAALRGDVGDVGGGSTTFIANGSKMTLDVDEDGMESVSDSRDEGDDGGSDDQSSKYDLHYVADVEKPDLILFTPLATGGKKEGAFLLHSSAGNLQLFNSVVQKSGSTDDEEGSDDDDEVSKADWDEPNESGTIDDESDSQKKDSIMPGFRDSFSSRPALSTRSGFGGYQHSDPSSKGLSAAASGYSDRGNTENCNHVINSDDRKRINRRIEGFGSVPPPSEKLRSPKTLRERLQAFRGGRMKKMSIGKSSWTVALENRMIDMMDAVLPPPPEIDDDDATTKPISSMPKKVSDSGAIDDASAAYQEKFEENSISREAWGDDRTYCIYLERELRKRDLESSSWKKRAMDLEEEVIRLKGLIDDISSRIGPSGQRNEEREFESKWQMEIPKVGVLIDLGGSYGGDDCVDGDPTISTKNHGECNGTESPKSSESIHPDDTWIQILDF